MPSAMSRAMLSTSSQLNCPRLQTRAHALAISPSRKIRKKRGIWKALVRVDVVVERALREELHDQRERPPAYSLELDQVAMVQQPACHVRVVSQRLTLKKNGKRTS
jgi:hypothetical protein